MANYEEEGAKWAELQKDYIFANQAARQARLAVTRKFMECAKRIGPEPTLDELAEVDRLERIADDAKTRGDIFIQELFKFGGK